jgi:hypothetical protein
MNLILESIRPYARSILQVFRTERDIRIVGVDELFPHAPRTELLQKKAIKTPELSDATCVPGVAEYESPTYTCPAVEAVELRDVLFCPVNNVVLTEDGRVLAETITTIRRPEYLDDHALSARRVEVLSGTHTALRSRFNHYYHHLIDHASRLYFLDQLASTSREQIGLLLRDGPTDFEDYLLTHLKPDPVHPVELGHRRLYRVERYLLITPMTRRHAGFQRQPYLSFFRRRTLPDRPSRRTHRIYIRREPGRVQGRAVQNEEEVLDLLSRFGFQGYRPEELSFSEQAELFYDAEAVVAPHGAGLSNLIYAPTGTKVLEWFPSHHLVPSFYFLAKSVNHVYRRYHDDGQWRDDDIEIHLPTLRRAVQALNLP